MNIGGLPPFSYDELQKNIGGLVYPNGIAPDGMSQEQMFRQGVGQLGAGMLAASNKNPMQALGMSYLEAQNQGLNNARQTMVAKEFKNKEDERKQGLERQNAWKQWVANNKDKFGQYGDMAQYMEPNEALKLLSSNDPANEEWGLTTGYAVRENPETGEVETFPTQMSKGGKFQVLNPETGRPFEDTKGFKFMGPDAVAEAKKEGSMRLEAPAAKARVTRFQQAGKNIRNQVGMLLKNPDALAAATGQIDARIPSYQQSMQNARDIIFGLESMLSARALQEMRDASPTGGAVGQVTEAEWGRLAATIANLKQTQGTPQFMEQLQLLWKQLDESEQIATELYQNTHGAYSQRRPELQLSPYEMPPMPDALTNFTAPGATGGADLQLPPGVVVKSVDGKPYQPPAQAPTTSQAPNRAAVWGQ
jgi:hypothetical protein